ncbi:MAG: ATP-grasp domain-containing protein [Bacteroidota bacterium]
MRRVYLQTAASGDPLSVNTFLAGRGFADFGYEVIPFPLAELDRLDRTPEDLVVGHIGTVHRALRALGRTPPAPLQPTPALLPFLKRRVWTTTLGQIRTLADVPVFIKPLTGAKSFTGHVVSEFGDLVRSSAEDDDVAVLAQGVLDIVSEWRAYVIRGSVVGIAHYGGGDPLAFPDRGLVAEALAAYADAPAGFCLDVCVTSGGDTALVEVNDGYSLGNYGLPAHPYARLLEARWDEMVAHG